MTDEIFLILLSLQMGWHRIYEREENVFSPDTRLQSLPRRCDTLETRCVSIKCTLKAMETLHRSKRCTEQPSEKKAEILCEEECGSPL